MSKPVWESWQDRPYVRRTGAHNLVRAKRLPWPFCYNCKLIALNNKRTRKVLSKPCTWLEDC